MDRDNSKPSRRTGAVPLAVATALLLAPLVAHAEEERANPLDEHTALTVGAKHLKLGVFAFEYGLTDRLSIGIDPPVWALRSVSDVFVPNLHAKGTFLRTSNTILSGLVAVYYARIGSESAKGHLLMVPLTLLSSTQVEAKSWVHLELNYNWIRGFGSGNPSDVEVGGALAMRTWQIGAMFEYRLTRVVALLARARYQVFSSSLVVKGHGELGPYTTFEGGIEAHPANPHPGMVLAGTALTWRHVGVVLGAGYGHYFIPNVNMSLPYRNIVPEASLWAYF